MTDDRYELYKSAMKRARYWTRDRDISCLLYFARGALLMADQPLDVVKEATSGMDHLMDFLMEIWERGQPLIEDEGLAKAYDLICSMISGD